MVRCKASSVCKCVLRFCEDARPATSCRMEDLRQLQILAQEQIRDLRGVSPQHAPGGCGWRPTWSPPRGRTAETFPEGDGHSGDLHRIQYAGGPAAGDDARSTADCSARRCITYRNTPAQRASRWRWRRSERGLEISIDDNGHGFSFAGSYSLEELELLRLGPESLKRRARSLNADLLLESRPGRGAGLKFRVPLQ